LRQADALTRHENTGAVALSRITGFLFFRRHFSVYIDNSLLHENPKFAICLTSVSTLSRLRVFVWPIYSDRFGLLYSPSFQS
jgi:hypothetical protein